VLEAGTQVPLPEDLRNRAIDIVGTGGDRSHSINVSTMAAIVTAGAGVPVCKHGARAASSKCGTADVLEALGVAVELSPEGVLRCVQEVGIGFCLAPRYHPAFRFAAPSRREIGIPTVFNLLGPMANPGRVRHQLIGVANPDVAERMLASLRLHGSHRAWVVHGNGLDELTTTGTSTVLALEDDGVRSFTVDPVWRPPFPTSWSAEPPTSMPSTCAG
jgi:anthranilate phosphoribosyltransferase